MYLLAVWVGYDAVPQLKKRDPSILFIDEFCLLPLEGKIPTICFGLKQFIFSF